MVCDLNDCMVPILGQLSETINHLPEHVSLVSEANYLCPTEATLVMPTSY